MMPLISLVSFEMVPSSGFSAYVLLINCSILSFYIDFLSVTIVPSDLSATSFVI